MCRSDNPSNLNPAWLLAIHRASVTQTVFIVSVKLLCIFKHNKTGPWNIDVIMMIKRLF
jgi:hypothetical protein